MCQVPDLCDPACVATYTNFIVFTASVVCVLIVFFRVGIKCCVFTSVFRVCVFSVLYSVFSVLYSVFSVLCTSECFAVVEKTWCSRVSSLVCVFGVQCLCV